MSDAARPLRLVSWNIEDLTRHLPRQPTARRGRTWPSLQRIVEHFEHPDILCLQEIRVRPGDADLLEAMTKALDGYALAYSLCDDPRNATFRGGRMYGVATWVRRELDPAAEPPVVWDREGRVSVTTLARERLAVVNVYAVNRTSKPYWDHELGHFRGDRHELKRRFHELIVELGRGLSARGLDLVLVGDWNISRGPLDTFPRLRTEEPHALARKLFNDKLIVDLDVVDVFRHLHPERRAYTWHNRRAPPGTLDAARVDFALVSQTLLDRVIDADILDALEHRFGSDHAPLSLSLRRR